MNFWILTRKNGGKNRKKEGEKKERNTDCTCLECRLEIDREVCAIGHERHTGRIAVNAVDTDTCLTAHHTVKRHVLVCVCEQAASLR